MVATDLEMEVALAMDTAPSPPAPVPAGPEPKQSVPAAPSGPEPKQSPAASVDQKPAPKDSKGPAARKQKMKRQEMELLVNLGLEERAIRDSYDNQAIIVCLV